MKKNKYIIKKETHLIGITDLKNFIDKITNPDDKNIYTIEIIKSKILKHFELIEIQIKIYHLKD